MDSTLYIPAKVRFEPTTNLSENDINTILEKINRHTLEPLKADEVFWFSGNCSNDGLDSHFTRMDAATTLKNYERALQAGTPLLEGHNTYIDPYGRSFDGALLPSSKADSTAEVRGDWYIIRDLVINQKNSNNAIRAIKGGIMRDLSVGFGRGWYKCSSCGNDLMDYSKCDHFPGLKDENGQTVFAWIIDAELREVSTVYKGAAPGAYIDKSRAFAQQGELSGTRSATIEQLYNIELNEQKRLYFTNGGKKQMNLLEQLRAAVNDGTIETKSIMDAFSPNFRQADDIQLRNELGDEATVDGVKKLKAQAEQGRAYMADLVTRAVTARTKAQGESFTEEQAGRYKNMLERSDDIEFIRSEVESFEKQAKEKLGGGRQTEPENFDPATDRAAGPVDFQDDNIFAK